MTETAPVRYCPNCGAASTGGGFCAKCGHDLNAPSGPGTLSPGPPATSTSTLNWGGALILVAGVLAILGSFLPWITATAAFIGTITRNGIDGGGDGVFTIVLGIVIALMGIAILARSGSARTARVGTVICAVALGWVVSTDYGSVQGRVKDITSDTAIASVGMGLIVIGLAAVLAVVGAVLAGARKPQSMVA